MVSLSEKDKRLVRMIEFGEEVIWLIVVVVVVEG